MAHSLRLELRYHELTARLTTIVIRMNIKTVHAKLLEPYLHAFHAKQVANYL